MKTAAEIKHVNRVAQYVENQESDSALLLPLDEGIELDEAAMESSAQAGRQGSFNVGGNTVTAATQHLPEDQRRIVRGFHELCKRRRWDWPQIIAASKISKTVLWRVFHDTYRYQAVIKERDAAGEVIRTIPHPKGGQRIGYEKVCEQMQKVMRREIEAEKTETDFVETVVFTKIEWLCQRAFIRKRMGFIYGDGQVGKTTSLKEYARRHNSGETTYCEVPPCSGVQLLLKTIAKALRVGVNTSFDKLLEDVLDALDPSKLLILDEIHRVFTVYQKSSVMKCLDLIRYLHDQKRCGLVVCGTNVFRDQLREGEFFTYLKQLHRRGRAFELQLPTDPLADDVDMFCRRFGLPPLPEQSEATQLAHNICHQDGIGVFIQRLEDARDVAANRRQEIDWKHFVSAVRIAERGASNWWDKKEKTEK